MNFKEIIEEVFQKVNSIEDKGDLASYIPELANVNSSKFGVHISTTSQINFGLGNFREKFSIQSIAKVFSLCLAYKMLGERIRELMTIKSTKTKILKYLKKCSSIFCCCYSEKTY